VSGATTSLTSDLVPAPGARPASARPWSWVPTLYLAEGLPYAIVVTVSMILYKDLGVDNARIAFYTGWLYLPWVIKPFWSPLVEILKTRRLLIWSTELMLGAALAGVVLTLPGPGFFRLTLGWFWLMAFSAATHDIAADGFYMLALTEREQSLFVGIRNTFFRIALISGQGLLLILAGAIQQRTGNAVLAWQAAFAAAVGLLVCLAAYHRLVLPRPAGDHPGTIGSARQFSGEFFATFGAFFRKPKIVALLLFLLFYRFGEAQLVKMVPLFLRDARSAGGLGLTTEQVGLVASIGVAALLAGGVLGGVLVSMHGLRAWLWPMVLVMHLPDAVFLYLSRAQPNSMSVIGGCVALEQFGYGFGFTAYMLYMIRIARGPHQTAHYAICAGFMALGLMVPGLWSGRLQEILGYSNFFGWVLLATLPGFVVTALVPLEPGFGKRPTAG
jgi:PAT family beta-lactamase induction signal transducer AmpG